MQQELFRYYLRHFIRYFSHKKAAKIITVGLFMGVFFLLAWGVYIFFYEGFQYLSRGRDDYFRLIMPFYVYEVFLLIIFFLILASCLIIGIVTLFRQGSNAWIIASPQYKLVLHKVFWNMLFSSVWPLLVIVLPALYAIDRIYGFGKSDLLIVLLSLIFFVLTIVMASLLSIFIIGFIISAIIPDRWGGTNHKLLAYAIGIAGAALLALTWVQLGNLDPVTLFQASNLNRSEADVSGLVNRFSVFPSHPVAYSVFLLSKNAFESAAILIFKQVAIFGAVFAGYAFAGRRLLILWQKMQEGNYHARINIKITGPKNPRFLWLLKSSSSAIIYKELLLLLRDVKNVSWLVFSILLWLIYSGINAMLIHHRRIYSMKASELPQLLPALQFIIIVYFVSALVLRFALPAFSSERKTAWILATSPLDMKKLFFAKIGAFSSLFILLGLTLGSLNIFAADFSLAMTAISLALFALAIVFITVVGLALGAIFPNFETDDPQVMSTSLSGLTFIFCSLVYGALGTFFFYNLLKGQWIGIIIFSFITLLALVLISKLAVKSLEKIEFVRQSN